MTDDTISLPDAAHRLGVPLRVLRHAMRAGTIPAPAHLTATSALPAGWLREAEAAIEAAPHALRRTTKQKVPSFARYEGTSAWRKYTVRVREYRHFLASDTARQHP
jgi:hypothetical protein